MGLYGKRVTGTGTLSGSISKILISGDNDADAGATAVFDYVSWGTMTFEMGSDTGVCSELSAESTNMTFPAGSYVEGPICSFQLASGTVLAFLNDQN